MMLFEAIESYVRLKQSLGAVFATDRRILRSFGRHLGDIPMDTISAETCLTFYQGGTDIGRTIPADHGAEIRVGASVEAARFEAMFLDTLNGRMR
jgi:hypothetical protein